MGISNRIRCLCLLIIICVSCIGPPLMHYPTTGTTVCINAQNYSLSGTTLEAQVSDSATVVTVHVGQQSKIGSNYRLSGYDT